MRLNSSPLPWRGPQHLLDKAVPSLYNALFSFSLHHIWSPLKLYYMFNCFTLCSDCMEVSCLVIPMSPVPSTAYKNCPLTTELMKDIRQSPTHTEPSTNQPSLHHCPDGETEAGIEEATVSGHPAEPGLNPSLRPPCLAVSTASQPVQPVPCHCPGLVNLMRALGAPDESIWEGQG